MDAVDCCEVGNTVTVEIADGQRFIAKKKTRLAKVAGGTVAPTP
jgi:hypothetical protein